jgi:hypothetical protein
MDIREALTGSLRLLTREPKVFLPRLVTTMLYSLFTLYSIGLTADFMVMRDPQLVAGFIWKVAALLALLPAIYLIDILSYAMYPRIVADYQGGKKVNLTTALKDAVRIWRVVVALGLTVFTFLVFVMTVSGFLQYLTAVTGNILYTILSALLALMLLLVFSVVVFFVVPTAVLDNKGVRESFGESIRLGLRYKGALLKLNLLFTLLVLATMLFVFTAELMDTMSAASMLVFILIRLLQAIVYTYVSVTNPLVYLQLRVNKTPGE